MDKRRMCPHCRAFITTSDKTCPYCNEQVAPRAVDRRNPSPIGGFIPQVRFNTIIILVINFGLYLATSLFSMNAGRGNAMNLDGQTLIDFGAMYVPLIRDGEWWRLVTAGFLHGGMLHILMNSWVLFDLGAQVEEMYGASRMLVIYFVSNICGFYLSSLFSPGLSIGASAAACGLIGAMIALGVRDRTGFGAAIRGAYIRWAVYMLIFSVMIKGQYEISYLSIGICARLRCYRDGRGESGEESRYSPDRQKGPGAERADLEGPQGEARQDDQVLPLKHRLTDTILGGYRLPGISRLWPCILRTWLPDRVHSAT
jgi:rhomboid protease GluP